MEVIANSEAQTQELASQFSNAVTQVGMPVLFWLSGEIGTGKTTFVRGFLHGAGWDARVKSPTYTLVEPYTVKGQDIFHFDLYRVRDYIELENMGIRDYFINPAIHLIEWAERMEELLPSPDIHIYFSHMLTDSNASFQQRKLRILGRSDKGQQLIKAAV